MKNKYRFFVFGVTTKKKRDTKIIAKTPYYFLLE